VGVSGTRPDIVVCGTGAVSPAGWGIQALADAVAKNEPLPIQELPRPGAGKTLTVRQVPAPSPRPACFANPRLRRASPISQYAVAAALEALGADAAKVNGGSTKLGIILCVMSGCVNYSRRFYDETLRDPATASPLVFPETVFNAPSSHLAALLGTSAMNYTLVGDPGTFLQGLALATNWLLDELVDACLVIGAEEIDWLTSHAFRLFARDIVLSDGGGAVYLRRGDSGAGIARISAITNSHLFTARQSRSAAARKMRRELSSNGSHAPLLIDGVQDLRRYDSVEQSAWADWKGARVSPKRIMGEGLMAASAWQTVLAIHAVANGASAAMVSVLGTNQQAIGAEFAR